MDPSIVTGLSYSRGYTALMPMYMYQNGGKVMLVDGITGTVYGGGGISMSAFFLCPLGILLVVFSGFSPVFAGIGMGMFVLGMVLGICAVCCNTNVDYVLYQGPHREYHGIHQAPFAPVFQEPSCPIITEMPTQQMAPMMV